jgi:hypothetical protein
MLRLLNSIAGRYRLFQSSLDCSRTWFTRRNHFFLNHGHRVVLDYFCEKTTQRTTGEPYLSTKLNKFRSMAFEKRESLFGRVKATWIKESINLERMIVKCF